MDEIKNKARELLQSGDVNIVIGYETSKSGKIRPVFITKPEEANKLVFNSRCINNLAVYLHKHEVKSYGMMAIVAPIQVLRTIVQLAAENQLKEEKLVVLGVSPEGKVTQFGSFDEIEKYVALFDQEIDEKSNTLMAKIESLPPQERWKFWSEELSQCFKCYACRAACPLCYCEKCTIESNQPQWIRPTSDTIGNFEWHIMRAMHMAGRCTDCGSCADACPLGIPLNLFTRKMRENLKEQFGTIPVVNSKGGNVLSTYKSDDKENFIR